MRDVVMALTLNAAQVVGTWHCCLIAQDIYIDEMITGNPTPRHDESQSKQHIIHQEESQQSSVKHDIY